MINNEKVSDSKYEKNMLLLCFCTSRKNITTTKNPSINSNRCSGRITDSVYGWHRLPESDSCEQKWALNPAKNKFRSTSTRPRFFKIPSELSDWFNSASSLFLIGTVGDLTIPWWKAIQSNALFSGSYTLLLQFGTFCICKKNSPTIPNKCDTKNLSLTSDTQRKDKTH